MRECCNHSSCANTRTLLERAVMSLGVVVLAIAVVFVLVIAARPLWDIRRQLWTTLDWRDLTVLALAVLALLLPIGALTVALPHVPWLENIVPKSLVPDKRLLVSNQANSAQSLNHQGEVYRSQGRDLEAEALFKEAWAIVEKAGGLTHPDASLPLISLAQLYFDQGRYAEAEALYERALAIREAALGHDDLSLGLVLIRLADLYRIQGRYAEAAPLYQRALTIHELAFGSDHLGSATARDNLAQLFCPQGRLAEAELLFKPAVASQARLDVAVCLHNLADLYSAQGRHGEAEPLYKRALAVLDDVLDRHLLSQRSAASDGQIFQIIQRALAAEAGASFAEQAAGAPAANVRNARVYPGLQDTTGEWHKRHIAPPPNPDHTTEIDSATGINQHQKFALPQFAAMSHTEPLTLGQVQGDLRSDEALVLYLIKPERNATLAVVVTKTDVRWRWSDLSSKALTERINALRCGLDPVLWKDAQSADKCHKLLQLSVGAGRGYDTENLPFNLASAHDLYRALLAPFRDIIKDKSLLIAASPSLSDLPFNVLVTESPSTAILSRLDQYRNVPWLGTQHPITVLPSLGAVRALPRRAKMSLASRAYLGIGNPLLDGQQDHPEWGWYYKRRALASWDKQHCPEAEARHRTAVASQTAMSPGGGFRVDEIRRWDPLPETADVLCEVGRRLGSSKSDILLGSEASESVLRALSQAGRLAQYRILYFGTHCVLTGDEQGVGGPGLVLTPLRAGATRSEKLHQEDGLLTAHEIKTLKLDADLVALSPCSTVGRSGEKAEILSSLSVAFFHAGARALLVPYWKGSFEATVQLTTAAFAQLNANPSIGPAEAMRNSMRSLIMHGSLLEAHPSQWAPFAVVGNGAHTNGQ
jgi:CHAT domain-containing protein/tetratricopeptide (TPR) repeat protein